MDYFAIILGLVVIFYVAVYAYKSFSILRRWIAAKKSRNINIIQGEVCGKLNEENKIFNGVAINFCYPKYRFFSRETKNFIKAL